MKRSVRRILMTAAILGAATGCTRSVVQQNKQPPDPLLISKKPVEGKPTSNSSARSLARIDPQPPAPLSSETSLIANGQSAPVQLSSELVVRPEQ
jgi:hypothetical protein